MKFPGTVGNAWPNSVLKITDDDGKRKVTAGSRWDVNGIQLSYDDRDAGEPLWVVPNGGHGPIFGPLAAPFVDAAMAHLLGTG